MHASVKNVDRNEWRAPADDTVQVVNPKAKEVKVGMSAPYFFLAQFFVAPEYYNAT